MCAARNASPFAFAHVQLAELSAGRKRRAAFTLVELLVVLAIISLLVSLLMPTLIKARRQAESVVCLSNLRQLGAAFMMYTNDNRNAFPRPSQNVVLRPEDWIHYQDYRGRNFADGALARYASDPMLYRCPSDIWQQHRTWREPFWPFESRFEYSYTVNELICRLYPHQTLRRNQIRRPSEKILLVDEADTTIDDGCWAWQPQQGIDGNVMSIRHAERAERAERELKHYGPRGNVVFCDGHAGMVSRADSFSRGFFDPRY